MGKAKISDRDNGAKALLGRLRTGLQGLSVGFQSDGPGGAAHENSKEGLTVIDIVTFHEFGIGVPRRSIVGDWTDQNETLMISKMNKAAEYVVTGKGSPEQAVNAIGLWAVGSMQERVSAGIPPPNAQSTIDRKGSSTPMIDTGQTRASIAHKVYPPGVKRGSVG